MIRHLTCDLGHICGKFRLCWLVIGLLTLSLPLSANDNETRVRKEKSHINQDLITPEDRNSATPERQVSRLRGVALSRFGGPLEPTQTLMQGFSGDRIGVFWDGFALEDPSGGYADLSQIPFFAAQKVWGEWQQSSKIGGELHLTTAKSDASRWRMAYLSGDQGTQRWQMQVQHQPTEHLKSFSAFQAAKTDGDFTFQPKSQQSELPWEIRGNNDQARQTLLQWNEFKTKHLKQTLLLLYHNHEGGIPGFAANPFPDLRGQNESWLVGAKTQWPQLVRGLSLRMQLRGLRRQTFFQSNPFAPSEVTSHNTQWSLAYQKAFAPLSLVLKSQTQIQLRQIETSPISQRIFYFPLSLQQSLLDNFLIWQLWGQVLWQSNQDPQPMGGAKIKMNFTESFWFQLGGHQKTRLPSLQEMYAPAGFVLGNPDLEPERTSDIFADLGIQTPHLHITGSLFYAQSDELIFYVNKNAFELAPINTGSTERWLAALKGVSAINENLLLQAGYDAFYSEMNATSAPLPGVPPHRLWAKLSLGATLPTQIHVHHAYRSETTGDLYGNLKLAPYHLTDIQVEHAIDSNFRLYLNVDNIFNVGYARDIYFLPLPGRQIFTSIEVSL
tara:strand:- start:1143 stop:2975 length:1833 start_codon:yes stop_codon:yes gene_type:complete